jgi:hypothetical protein
MLTASKNKNSKLPSKGGAQNNKANEKASGKDP